jgi:hypothetical protein
MEWVFQKWEISMKAELARALLIESRGAEDPVMLPPNVLKHITLAEVPEDTTIQVGT